MNSNQHKFLDILKLVNRTASACKEYMEELSPEQIDEIFVKIYESKLARHLDYFILKQPFSKEEARKMLKEVAEEEFEQQTGLSVSRVSKDLEPKLGEQWIK